MTNIRSMVRPLNSCLACANVRSAVNELHSLFVLASFCDGQYRVIVILLQCQRTFRLLLLLQNVPRGITVSFVAKLHRTNTRSMAHGAIEFARCCALATTHETGGTIGLAILCRLCGHVVTLSLAAMSFQAMLQVVRRAKMLRDLHGDKSVYTQRRNPLFFTPNIYSSSNIDGCSELDICTCRLDLVSRSGTRSVQTLNGRHTADSNSRFLASRDSRMHM
eukprot:SAG31_NODE_4919_length_2868_cov_1.265800_2_plen_220_part_00